MPPTYEGRFKPPRVHRGWQLLQAVDYGPACPQPIQYVGATKGVRDMDEDCLYLNVFSPNVSRIHDRDNILLTKFVDFHRQKLELPKNIQL